MVSGRVGPRIAAMALVASTVWAASGCRAADPVATSPSARTWTPAPATATPPPTQTASATSSTTPTASPAPAATGFPIAVITRYDDTRPSISSRSLTQAARAAQILVPCEVTQVWLDGGLLALSDKTQCLPAAEITARVHATAGALALLPPGLVSPSIKVLPIGEADLFGSPRHRAVAYPLVAATAAPQAWTRYRATDVRTLVSTGDTCPDRGVSHQAVFAGKGWDWTLSGGTVRYDGFHQSSWNWPVPDVTRSGHAGAVAALVSDSDLTANDFECALLTHWIQHDTGMVFDIDPAVASLLAGKGGVDVVTLGSNHITDYGVLGVEQTLKYLDAAGVKHTGAGMNLAGALAPAVVTVRGLRFAFVGWDDGYGDDTATSDRPGVAQLTYDNVCQSIKAARAVADIVIAMPQWGWPEYHNDITPQQRDQRQVMYDCGADGILGSGTHWASWASILPGPSGPRFAIGSHGNFLFDQQWSRETMEGVVVEVTFVGTRVAQFRLHPYVIVDHGQPNLTDPATDGQFVLQQVWSVSDIQ
jgi:poly-gamma-glutamate synthesis protein (capsule biosynthesis protein)